MRRTDRKTVIECTAPELTAGSAEGDILAAMASPHEVTRLLKEWANGSQSALDALTPLVYGELRRLAASYMRRESPGHTLQPTALVHEAFLRLAGRAPDCENRSQFY